MKYRLTIDGVPIGKPYFCEQHVREIYLKLVYCIRGLGWTAE